MNSWQASCLDSARSSTRYTLHRLLYLCEVHLSHLHHHTLAQICSNLTIRIIRIIRSFSYISDAASAPCSAHHDGGSIPGLQTTKRNQGVSPSLSFEIHHPHDNGVYFYCTHMHAHGNMPSFCMYQLVPHRVCHKHTSLVFLSLPLVHRTVFVLADRL